MEERTFVDSHGVEVFTRWWKVPDPRGVVLIAHGASEHSGRYDRFARALAGAGFAAVALDHRGHGRTAAATKPGVTGPGGGDSLVDDLHELRAAAVAEFGPSVPVFLFGHSMGSLIGLAYLTRHSEGLAGGVLCGMAADVEGTAELGAAFAGFAEMRDQPAADLLADYNKPFEPGRTRYDWLSRDEAEVDRYIDDPMCGDGNPLTFGYFMDLFEVVAPAADRLGDVACPVLVIAGDQDPAAAMGANATKLGAALRAAGVPSEVIVYEGARHELLNETNRDGVTEDVTSWLQRLS
jgi:alpha-beta hydrolase superfamily lysophospholipase